MAQETQMLTGTAASQPSYSFNRPADTTPYAVGDLVANSTTAASVVPISWSNVSRSGSFYPVGVILQKSGATATNASFRVHLYSAAPSVATTGDNGVYATVVSGNGNWLGSYDGTMVASHADGCSVTCTPTEGIIDAFVAGQNPTIYALIEARGAYTPASGETFTARLLVETN